MEEVRALLSDAKRPVILGISETWLDGTVLDGEVSIPGYSQFRRDRGSRGGGVLVYVPESCHCRRRRDLEDHTTEAIWIKLHLKKCVIMLCNIYRPPKAASSTLESLSYMIERGSAEGKEVVLMGDMNCNWMSPNRLTDGLNLITEESNLKQLIAVPTRTTENSQTLIDLLFSSDPDQFSFTGAVAFTGRDHLMIYGEREERVSTLSQVTTVRSFKKCDKDALLSDLDRAPWHVMEMFSSVDEMWDYWLMRCGITGRSSFWKL